MLAFLHEETGSERVAAALEGAFRSTVNRAEIVQKALQRQVDVSGMDSDLTDVGVQFVSFTPSRAETAAGLWNKTRSAGLSLADRACLAPGLEHRVRVLTVDPSWARLGLDLDIELIR